MKILFALYRLHTETDDEAIEKMYELRYDIAVILSILFWGKLAWKFLEFMQ